MRSNIIQISTEPIKVKEFAGDYDIPEWFWNEHTCDELDEDERIEATEDITGRSDGMLIFSAKKIEDYITLRRESCKKFLKDLTKLCKTNEDFVSFSMEQGMYGLNENYNDQTVYWYLFGDRLLTEDELYKEMYEEKKDNPQKQEWRYYVGTIWEYVS